MDKQQLSERDICTKYITPAIQKAGWDKTAVLIAQHMPSITFYPGVSGFSLKRPR